MSKTKLLKGLLILGFMSLGFTQEGTTYPLIKPGATMFLYYGYTIDPLVDTIGKNFNSFDVTRTYLNLNAEFSRHFKARLTLDSKRFTEFLEVFVKYAWVEANVPLLGTSTLRMLFGEVELPFLGPIEEKIWGFRVLGPPFADKEKKLSTTDFGFRSALAIPKGYGEIDIAFTNGEGYSKPEVNEFKNVESRVSIVPFNNIKQLSKFKLHGFYSLGKKSTSYEYNRGIIMATYEHNYLTLGFQYLIAQDSTNESAGFSGFLVLKSGTILTKNDQWGFLARIDQFSPDRAETGDASHTFGILGLYVNLNKNLRWILDYQTMKYGKDYPKIPEQGNETATIYSHILVNF